MKVNKRKNKENSNASDKKKSQKQYTLGDMTMIMICEVGLVFNLV